MTTLAVSHVLIPIGIVLVLCLLAAATAATVTAIVQLVRIGVQELAYRHRQRKRANRSKPFSGGR